MSPAFRRLSLVLATLWIGTLPGCSQTDVMIPHPPPPGHPGDPAAAYVYVSTLSASDANQILAYSAASDGTLSLIGGSPFSPAPCAVTGGCGPLSLAANGMWLFATDSYNIDSLSIAANGALTQAQSYVAGYVSPTGSGIGGGPADLFFDQTGTTLYDGYYYLNLPEGGGNNGYQSFSVAPMSGQITLVNQMAPGPQVGQALSFLSNNQFAYTSSCYHGLPAIYGFQRGSDGSLTELTSSVTMPTAPSNEEYCPYLAAADVSGHLTVAVQPNALLMGGPLGPYQLASYTADAAGNLTTTSTAANMPTVAVGDIDDYRVSPDGHYLAVAGAGGLQVFHCNGAGPVTSFTDLLVNTEIDHVGWDNNDHLYAIGRGTGQLFVFAVSPFGVMPAIGSPYSVPNATSLVILPRGPVASFAIWSSGS